MLFILAQSTDPGRTDVYYPSVAKIVMLADPSAQDDAAAASASGYGLWLTP